MANEKSDWRVLIGSIRGNRAGRATFYKPVCVIAAIDLADIGRLDSELLHSELILRRFGEYVGAAFPERAAEGWQPLWFLANDGLWTFSKKGKRLTRADIQSAPSTKSKTFARFDTQAIAREYRNLWEAQTQRRVLRDQMLLILARYAENRTLLRAIFNASDFTHPDKWISEDVLDQELDSLSGQSDLFREPTAFTPNKQINKAGTRKALLDFDVDALPPASAVGPIFEDTGDAPVRLTAATIKELAPRAELHQALAEKCLHLQGLAAASNRAAHILPALLSLSAALEVPASQSSSYLIWSHGNTLRRLHDAEQRASENEDPESPPLPDRLGALFEDIIDQFNAYAVVDPIVVLLDRAKGGPERRSKALMSLDAGTSLVRAIEESGVVEPEAAQILETTTEAAQNAANATGFNADQAVLNAVEIQRNGALAILQNALKEIRKALSKTKGFGKQIVDGAAKQVGGEIVKQLPLASFVASVRDYFTPLWHEIAGSDNVHKLVALIRSFISHISS